MSNRPIRMLRLPKVIDATGLTKTKIYELQKRGDFPIRVRLTAHAVAWVEEEVQAWLAKQNERARSGNTASRVKRPDTTPKKKR